MDIRAVAANLEIVQQRIAAACAASGRLADAVRLVAVSKRIPDDLVVAACAAGQRDLGENRVQDAVARQMDLAPQLAAAGVDPETIRWHFIGHLQGNKAGRASGRFHLLHGVDSLKLAAKLARLAEEAGRREPVLLEVNISGEDQKHGFAPGAAVAAAAETAALPGLELRGFMGMARYGAADEETVAAFADLRRLAASAREITGLALPELSMGMSGDYEAAVGQGATVVRVGSAIFGPRG
ncbi:MAG: YggS family pyridoxal phosphate-dependent enzyme [bacterium]|nr:YggS family pyridoxal phosphate-dependent enzyme [bacterium]